MWNFMNGVMLRQGRDILTSECQPSGVPEPLKAFSLIPIFAQTTRALRSLIDRGRDTKQNVVIEAFATLTSKSKICERWQ